MATLTPVKNPKPAYDEQGRTTLSANEYWTQLGYNMPNSSTPPATPPATTSPTPPAGNVRTPLFDTDGSQINAPMSFTDYQSKYPQATVDENKIRQDMIKQRQAQIDAINQVYNQMVELERARQAQLLKGEVGQTRAIGARSGLIGSDFGAAQMATTKQQGAERERLAVENIQARKSNAIQALYGEIDKQAQNKAQAELARQQGQIDEYRDYLENEQEDARTTILAAGQQGLSYEDLKTQAPDRLQQLLSNANLDEFEADILLQSQQPAGMKSDIKYMNLGDGTLLKYGTNADGTQVQEIVDYGVEAPKGNYDVKVSGKNLLFIPDNVTDPNDVIIKPIGSTGGTGGGGTTTTTQKPMTTNQIEQFRRSYGWTPPFGYTQEQLLKYMEDNPNATPEELEAGAKQVTPTTTNTTTDTTTQKTGQYLTTDYLKTNYDKDTLKDMSDKFGSSKWYTFAGRDINRFLDAVQTKIQEARAEGYTDEEIEQFLKP